MYVLETFIFNSLRKIGSMYTINKFIGSSEFYVGNKTSDEISPHCASGDEMHSI